MMRLLPAFVCGAAVGAVIVAFGTMSTDTARADAHTSTSTVEFFIEKDFSGSQEGFERDDFSFRITGDGVDETLPHQSTIDLEVGSYLIEEITPSGFDLDDWTIQWSGQCQNKNAASATTTLEVTESHVAFPEGSQIACRADNQFKPGEPPGDDDDEEDGELVIVKHVINDNNGTSTPEDFSFTINGTSTTAFDASGTTTLMLAPDTYTIVELAAEGYDVSYDNCTDITLTAGGSATCTITNDDEADGDGDGDGDEERYKIFGHVWHDEDRDGDIDGEEDFRNGGILITITNGTTTATTTTDEGGFYSFEVPAGTWTISQDIEDPWEFTFPDTEGHTHTVTVPEEENDDTAGIFERLWALVVPAAHAADVEEFGPFNFGNALSGGNGGGDGDGDGDGGGNGDGDGGGISGGFIDDDDDDGLGGGDARPTGAVAGAQTEILPRGGALTGAGGTAGGDRTALFFIVLALIIGAAGIGLARMRVL